MPGFGLTPYIHPRLALVNGFAEADGLDADIRADVGVDVELSRTLILRLGVGLGGGQADWGVGLPFRR